MRSFGAGEMVTAQGRVGDYATNWIAELAVPDVPSHEFSLRRVHRIDEEFARNVINPKMCALFDALRNIISPRRRSAKKILAFAQVKADVDTDRGSPVSE